MMNIFDQISASSESGRPPQSADPIESDDDRGRQDVDPNPERA